MIVVLWIFDGFLSVGCIFCSAMVYCSTSVVFTASVDEVYPVGYHVFFVMTPAGASR